MTSRSRTVVSRSLGQRQKGRRGKGGGVRGGSTYLLIEFWTNIYHHDKHEPQLQLGYNNVCSSKLYYKTLTWNFKYLTLTKVKDSGWGASNILDPCQSWAKYELSLPLDHNNIRALLKTLTYNSRSVTFSVKRNLKTSTQWWLHILNVYAGFYHFIIIT